MDPAGRGRQESENTHDPQGERNGAPLRSRLRI